MSRPRPFDKGWLAHYRELIGTWARGNPLAHDASDAAQDSMAHLLANDPAAVLDRKAYLFRCARNRLVSEIRRQARGNFLSLDTLAEEEHPSTGDPEATLRADQLARALKAALAELPLKSQQVFLWNKIEGYTQEEIAQRLGLTSSMVEKHMKRALNHLRDRLQQHASP
ncbi:MAG: sigma-70 family RNA polymerase sigma factor [Pigmentiphaga sp.]|nr:sigma-70 family RNA polymerase sigma factor [Pigmentiphaga sp.]